MGREFVVEFNEESDYWKCKTCGTHIALMENALGCFHEEVRKAVGAFSKVENVEVDEPVRNYRIGRNTVANIYCVKCGNELGCKIIGKAEFRFLDELHVVNDGMIELLLGNVSLRESFLTALANLPNV
ncbi:hypothetical protein ABFX02_04G184300 [Erythranthe guttata]